MEKKDIDEVKKIFEVEDQASLSLVAEEIIKTMNVAEAARTFDAPLLLMAKVYRAYRPVEGMIKQELPKARKVYSSNRHPAKE